jgi:electron transfer flavoprotein beta subunit
MNIIVCLKMVPDTVEELEVAADNKALDSQFLRFKLSDPDEHALEQALLLKEKHGGTVMVVALDAPEVDDVLFTALAKGATRAVKIGGDWSSLQSFAAAQIMAAFLVPPGQTLSADTLILVRSQAIDDLEGEVAPFIADLLGMPYIGVVTGVAIEGQGVLVTKEFAGGLRGEFALPLPAVLGVQSAEKPPRYVPIAKVRAVMKSAKIETVDVVPPESLALYPVDRMYKPEVGGRAQMLEGSPEEVADKIVAVLAKQSLI